MSTYMYLKCLDHDPPLLAGRESGQHTYDLPQIRADIAQREVLVAAFDQDAVTDDYFRSATIWFLAFHRKCRIGIEDEYGDQYPLVDEHQCDTGNFDRSLCPEPCGYMHSYCTTCGDRQDPCAHEVPA